MVRSVAVMMVFLILPPSSPAQPHWRLVPSTSGRFISALDFSHANPDTLYAITDIGLLWSTTNGETWDTLPGGRSKIMGILSALKVSPSNPGWLYVSHYFSQGGSNDLSLTKDQGLTWHLINRGGGIGVGAVIEIDPQDHETVYAGVGDGTGPTTILRTTDNGGTWSWRPDPPTSTITSLAIDPVDRSRLYSAYYSGFFRSTDTGLTWNAMDIGAPVGGPFTIPRVIVHPSTRAIYATCFPWAQNEGGMFCSTDGGDTWRSLNNGLGANNRGIWWISINPAKPNEMYLCTSTPSSAADDLMFFSSDTGHTWVPRASGLPRQGHAEFVVLDTGHRRAFTAVFTSPRDSCGLYILDLTSDADEPQSVATEPFEVFQNYPNPFNASTDVEFHLSTQQRVKVQVYNVLGQLRATLADGVFAAGRHRVHWEGGDQPSGVYLCRISTVVRRRTIVMILAK